MMRRPFARNLKFGSRHVASFLAGLIVSGMIYQFLYVATLFVIFVFFVGFDEPLSPTADRWLDRIIFWVILPALSIIAGWLSGKWVWNKVDQYTGRQRDDQQ